MDNDLNQPLLTTTQNEFEALQQPLNNSLGEDASTNVDDGLHSSNINEPLLTHSNDSYRDPWKNHNVILSFVQCIVFGIADSIWSSVVLSGFLLALATAMGQSKEGNTLVGTAEAVQGLTQLFTALPVGYLADTWGKSKTVRLGGVLMLFTIGMTLWSILDVKHNAEKSQGAAKRSYILLVVALAFWGVIAGIANGPSQALFSDSVPKGKRSELLTWLYSCYLLSSTVGPIVAIVLILTVSANAEDWSINEIFPVFFLGILLEIPAAILMCFFNDKYAVDEQPEDIQTTPDDGATTIASTEEGLDVLKSEDNLLVSTGSVDIQNHEVASFLGDVDATTIESAIVDSPIHISSRKAIIPYILFFSSLISSLGSGASVKYFPLFFKEVGFGSAAVQGIFLLVPISISLFSFMAQEAGKRIGRIETSFITIVIGVSLLLWMTKLSHNVGSSSQNNDVDSLFEHDVSPSSLWNNNPYKAVSIVIVYLFRTGIINCSYPLLESILMDNVPSNQRSRWKSLESIASFGWTGSALVGGILSDEHSYQFTFAITAWMQLASGLILLTIQPLVEKE